MDPSADEPRWAAIGCPQLRPWHFVLWFALVSLFADMVYEGARAIIGPYLATLGASATVVGAVAGAGKFIGYSLRVVSGYLVQRGRHYWTWTIAGYALTVLAVPLIGSTNVIAPALLLYGTERLSKAVRSPAKDTLLSHAATRTGRGTAFGVHQGWTSSAPGRGRCCWPQCCGSTRATTAWPWVSSSSRASWCWPCSSGYAIGCRIRRHTRCKHRRRKLGRLPAVAVTGALGSACRRRCCSTSAQLPCCHWGLPRFHCWLSTPRRRAC